MMIKVWIRPDKDGNPTLRLDYKYESKDTPTICRFGNKLMNAIEGTGEKDNENR